MSIHLRFAENLRKYCYSYKSISEVCTGIGINRQQFNKYLAGTCMPSGTTLRRICAFLNIREEELFSARPQDARQQVRDDARIGLELVCGAGSESGLQNLRAAFDTVSEGSARNAFGAVLPGLYYCYFPLHGDNRYLMRSLVNIKSDHLGITFTRLTIFPTSPGALRFRAWAKHRGIVMANSQDIYLLGFNLAPPHQISFLLLERPSVATPQLLTGLSIIRTSSVSMAARVCMQKIGRNVGGRKILQAIGPVSKNCPTVDPVVCAAMTARTGSFPGQLLGVSFAQTLVQTMTRSEPANLVFSALPA